MDYMEYLDSQHLPNKTLLENKLAKLTNKCRVLKYRETDFEDWRTVLYFIHNQILTHNYENRDLNNVVRNWSREDDMQKCIQGLINRFIIEERNEPPFSSGRERIIGGGKCDHYYKGIPISDKWIRDTNAKSYPTEINKFINKIYELHYEQVKSYAHNIKLAVMIVVDSREETKKNTPDMVKDCYDFRVNDEDGIVTAIFVIQISDNTPSKRR